jgi:hypothetical protein
MDPPPLSPTQAAALARARALTGELIELVARLRDERDPVPEPVDTLEFGELRSAFSAAVNARRRRPRWADELLT